MSFISIIYCYISTLKFSRLTQQPFYLLTVLWVSPLDWAQLVPLWMWWQSAGGSAGPGWSKRASLMSGDWYGSQLGLSSPMWFLILEEASLLGENCISKTSWDLGSDILQCNIYLLFGQSKSQDQLELQGWGERLHSWWEDWQSHTNDIHVQGLEGTDAFRRRELAYLRPLEDSTGPFPSQPTLFPRWVNQGNWQGQDI